MLPPGDPISSRNGEGESIPISIDPWPEGCPFALFLSHDVDQIFDREPYRILADLNHARRLLLGKEHGKFDLCFKRLGRSLFNPKPARREFECIRFMETRYNWRSTWFFLSGRRWSRYGARYRLEHPAVKQLAQYLLDEGCELGVHGGYYDLNNSTAYRDSANALESAFGVRPTGIRNHYLRWTGPETWRAQAEAGFAYDATTGDNRSVGFHSDTAFPLETGIENTKSFKFLELPLTVMDTTLFRYLRLSETEAIRTCEKLVTEAVRRGGLLSTLWHNNYFAEPEYADWERTYAALLDCAAEHRPWCATGEEITRWWRARNGIRIEPEAGERIRIRSSEPLEEVVFRVHSPHRGKSPRVEGSACRIEAVPAGWKLTFPRLESTRCTLISSIFN